MEEIMRYCFTDFFPWEKDILIPAYQKAGLHVYSVIDTGGVHFEIRNGMVNRFGYIILDEEIDVLTDTEFYALKPVEDLSLVDLKNSYVDEIEKASNEYLIKDMRRERQWHRLLENQNVGMNLERSYPLFKKFGKRKIPVYDASKRLILQYISVVGLPNKQMEVGYFLRDNETGEITKDSDSVIVERGCRTSTWLKAIEDKEGLKNRTYITD